MPFRHRVSRGDVVENRGAEVPPGILVALHLRNKLISSAKYSIFSFEKEQDFLALAIVGELKEET